MRYIDDHGCPDDRTGRNDIKIVAGPEESMFHKQAVCISTAAGAGMKSTNKDMAERDRI